MDLHFCSTAMERESLFYKSWSAETALLRAESKFEIVMGLLVERKVLNCLSEQIFGPFFVLASWGPGDRINKLSGLEGQGSTSSGRKKSKTKKIKK